MAYANVNAGSPPFDVTVLEGVWGDAFADLATRFDIERIHDIDTSDPDALRHIASQTTCLVVRNRTIVDRPLLAAAPQLRVIARAGAGLDNIDLAAANDVGVVVIAARGANARSVAELALGFALGLARRIPSLDRGVREGEWDRRPGVELSRGKWGVVGLGRTGIETARLARSIGMSVIGYDPYVRPDDPQVLDAGVNVQGLHFIRSDSDVLSLHIPLTPETRGMVDRSFLAGMRPGSFLINVARGEIVDEDALVWALTSETISGAALDVRSVEPSVPGALEAFDNVILTPHIAGLTMAAVERGTDLLAADLERLLNGHDAEAAVGSAPRIRP